MIFYYNIEWISKFNTLKTLTFDLEQSLVSNAELYQTGIRDIQQIKTQYKSSIEAPTYVSFTLA